MKSIELTDPEIQALIALMDAGVRNLGLQVANNAAVILNKLNTAKDVVNLESVKVKETK